MQFPQIAIVGRPNVGKSSLLNRLARAPIAIVDPKPGVTRDRITVVIEWEGATLEIVDTGGIGIVDEKTLSSHIQSQIELALSRADLILFMVDSKAGLTPLDLEIAEKLRRLERPLMLVVNKTEGRFPESHSAEFYKLGLGEMSLISTANGRGVDDLMDLVVSRIKKLKRLVKKKTEGPTPWKLAIIGRRNAGKSSVINYLVGEERVIVSEIPGTTRDAVDVLIEKEGLPPFFAIDTAGVRRKRSLQDSVEFFSLARAERAIRRCDAVLLLFDCTTEISDVDKKLARYVMDHYKPCVIGVSKWDLAKAEPEAFSHYIQARLPGLHFAPISFFSSKESINVWETVQLAMELHEQAGQRVKTGPLNQVLDAARSERMPSVGGNHPKLFYGTQVSVHPPTIVLFVNEPKFFGKEYDRFLQNRFREKLPFAEVPLRILYRKRKRITLPIGKTP